MTTANAKTKKTKCTATDDVSPLPDDVLTREEQKVFKTKLNEAKKVSGDTDYLARSAEMIRLQIIKSRAQNRTTASTQPKLLTLPGVIPVNRSTHLAPLSNWLARTSIFAPRPPGSRRHTGVNWAKLSSPRGVTIYYNGPELDMADHTLYLNLLKIAEGRKPNDTIYINRSQLLKKCGYEKQGTSSYDWLNAAFDRIFQANIKIVIDNTELRDEDKDIFEKDSSEIEIIQGKREKKLIMRLKMMGRLIEVPDTGDYYFTVPPESLALFANHMFGYNDLNIRLEIQKHSKGDLAAWLQSYICAVDVEEHHPVLVETLLRHSDSKSRPNDFIKRLKIALDMCQKSGVILSWEISKNEKKQWFVKWKR